MNRKQLAALWIIGALLITSWLFPPWNAVTKLPGRQVVRAEGFAFLGSPRVENYSSIEYRVDVMKLLLVDVALGATLAAILLTLANRNY